MDRAIRIDQKLRLTKSIDLKNRMVYSCKLGKPGKPVSAIVKNKEGLAKGKAIPMLSVTEENDYIVEENVRTTEEESSDNSGQNLEANQQPKSPSKQYTSSGDTPKLTVSPSKVLFKKASGGLEKNRTLSAQVPKPGKSSGIQRAGSIGGGMKNKLALENPSWQSKMDFAMNLQVDVPDALQGSMPRSPRGSEHSLSPSKLSKRDSPIKLDRLNIPTNFDKGLISRCPSPAHGFLVPEPTPDEIKAMNNSPRVGMGSRGNIDELAPSHNHDRPSKFDLDQPEQSHLESARHYISPEVINIRRKSTMTRPKNTSQQPLTHRLVKARLYPEYLAAGVLLGCPQHRKDAKTLTSGANQSSELDSSMPRTPAIQNSFRYSCPTPQMQSQFTENRKTIHESVTELKDDMAAQDIVNDTKSIIDIMSRVVAKPDPSNLDSNGGLEKIAEKKKNGFKAIVKPLNREHGIYYLANEDKMNKFNQAAMADLDSKMDSPDPTESYKVLNFIKRNKANVRDSHTHSKIFFF